jgi:uncharacterized membrane protein
LIEVPEESVPRGAQTVMMIEHRSTSFQGPLPDPQTLAQYKAISPELVERILTAADEQRAHRLAMDREHLALARWQVQGESQRARVGQAFAFLLLIGSLVAGTVCILMGHTGGGIGLFSAALTAVAGTLYLGQRAARAGEKERPDAKPKAE